MSAQTQRLIGGLPPIFPVYGRLVLPSLLCLLLLAGCQLYWRKPGAILAAFTA